MLHSPADSCVPCHRWLIYRIIGYIEQLKNPLQNSLGKYTTDARVYRTLVGRRVWYIKHCRSLRPSNTFLFTDADHLSSAFWHVQIPLWACRCRKCVLLRCLGRLRNTCKCIDLPAAPFGSQHAATFFKLPNSWMIGEKAIITLAVVCTGGLDLHRCYVHIPMSVALRHVVHKSITSKLQSKDVIICCAILEGPAFSGCRLLLRHSSHRSDQRHHHHWPLTCLFWPFCTLYAYVRSFVCFW